MMSPFDLPMQRRVARDPERVDTTASSRLERVLSHEHTLIFTTRERLDRRTPRNLTGITTPDKPSPVAPGNTGVARSRPVTGINRCASIRVVIHVLSAL